MGLIRCSGAIKVIFINLLIFVTPFIAGEIYFLHDKLDYRTKAGITCDAKLTNYDYCPSITHLRYMPLSDKWLPIVNYVDQNRRSTYKNPPKFSSGGKRIFLIGDSFIQADELRIEDRFEHMLREEGYEVHAFGYSSWNSKQFSAIVKSLNLRKDDHVFIFSMTNDYTPTYRASSIKTILNVVENAPAKQDDRTFLEKVMDNSLIVNTVRRAKSVVDAHLSATGLNATKPRSRAITFSHNIYNWKNCHSLPEVSLVSSPLVHDYLSLSKYERCWSESIQESVDVNIKLLKEAGAIIESHGAHLQIALVPAGWAFSNQNTIGRNHKSYNIPEGVVVSQIGLTDKLIKEGLDVIDLESLLGKYAASGANYLYFPADGHFTENAHRIIGNYLVEVLN